jgi:hypothetical protein
MATSRLSITAPHQLAILPGVLGQHPTDAASEEWKRHNAAAAGSPEIGLSDDYVR